MEAFWFVFPLLSAFFLATYNAILKRLFSTQDEYTTTFLSLAFTAALLFSLALVVPPAWPPPLFFLFMGLSVPLEFLAMCLYIKALKVSPLTLTLPFLSLTPAYLLVTSFLILGERVGSKGLFGVLLLVLGGYALNIESVRRGALEPFRAILTERGSLYMVIVSLLYSLTSVLGKKAILLSSPLTFAFFYYPLLFLCFGLLLWFWDGNRLKMLKDETAVIKALFPGLFNFLSILFHVIGISLAPVAYFIAIKRTSILFGMVYGFLLFKERQRLARLGGTLLMFAGFLLLILP